MAGKRSYNDGCAAAHALELVGERWALLVVRELTLGPKRFTDLRAGLPGISPNVLAQRLQELEAASLLVRRKLPPPGAVWVYELTAWGLELEPVIRAFGRWAARSPTLPAGRPASVTSIILSFRTLFDPIAAGDFEARLELRLDAQPFTVGISRGRIELATGGAEAPDAVVTSDPNALAAVIYGGRELAEALGTGDVEISGDRTAVERFIKLFPLPERAPATAQG